MLTKTTSLSMKVDILKLSFVSRPGHYGLDRYVVKRYAEQILSQTERWKLLTPYFSSITPTIRAYTLTSYEIALMRRILDYHLNDTLRLCITPSNDQLIEYDALVDFMCRVQELYVSTLKEYGNVPPVTVSGKKQLVPSIPVIPAAYILPLSAISVTSPSPQSTTPKTSSMKTLPIRAPPPTPPSQSNKTQGSTTVTNGHHTAQSTINSSSKVQNKSNVTSNQFSFSPLPELCPISLQNAKIVGNGWAQINNVYLPFIIKNRQRLVPYDVLVACKILELNELRSTLTPATLADITLINAMVQDCKINSEKLAENASLINIYHVLIGTKNLVYIKILPKDNPTTKINRQYKSILPLQGGSLYITTRLVPFVCSSNHSYIPLNDVLTIYPNLQTQLKGFARVPRTHELDYLQLVQMYHDEKELPADTLLIDMEKLNQIQITSSKTMSLIEYHAKEKTKLEQQIALLNKPASVNKRKNFEPHENKQKLKTSTSANQFRQPTSAFIRPTGHFPAPVPVNQPNPWLLSNTGHRGRTRWQ
jgi:hypothetical protein